MALDDLIIDQETDHLLHQHLSRFIEDTGVRIVMVMGRDGHLVAMQGDAGQVDATSLCALAVGAFASSEALARLAGEDNFNSIFHQGVRRNVYISVVGKSHLMLTLFDYNAGAPLVRLQAKVTAEGVLNILERAHQRTKAVRAGK